MVLIYLKIFGREMIRFVIQAFGWHPRGNPELAWHDDGLEFFIRVWPLSPYEGSDGENDHLAAHDQQPPGGGPAAIKKIWIIISNCHVMI